MHRTRRALAALSIVLCSFAPPMFAESGPSTSIPVELPALAISTNHHYLAESPSGNPFFLLADTAWNLDALTDEEIDFYLRDRHSHRFNTVMFCLNFFPQGAAENAYWQKAYVGPDNTELGVGKWTDALDTVAVDQLHYIIPLLQSRPYFERIPDPSLLLAGQSKQIADRVAVTHDGVPNQNDATYLLAYMASPKPITLDTAVLSAKTLNITWFDPATGNTQPFKSDVPNPRILELPAPPAPHDWVVIIDDASKHYTVAFH